MDGRINSTEILGPNESHVSAERHQIHMSRCAVGCLVARCAVVGGGVQLVASREKSSGLVRRSVEPQAGSSRWRDVKILVARCPFGGKV